MSVANDWWPRFSEAEYQRRYARLREAMRERGLDCLVVYGTAIFFGTDPGSPNLAYLAGYGPGCQGYVVFPLEGEPTLLIYVASHVANARLISVIPDVRGGTDLGGLASQRVRELGYEQGRIGIVGNFAWANISIPHEHYQALAEQLPGARLEIVSQWYEDLRLRKSDEELQFMAAGGAICDRAHEALRATAAPGLTEVALHNDVLRTVHAASGRIAFGHVGSTSMREPSMNYPNFYPLNRVVQWGDVIMTELTGGYGGYFGKLYGTVFVGEPTPRYRQMFELAAESYRAIYAATKPGVRGRDLLPVLAGRAAEAGYRSRSFITGWSTYNSRPVLFTLRIEEADRDLELQPGMCLNVGGWIITQDERAGVWVGDTAVVTEDGLRSFQRYPVDDLEYATLAR